MGYLKNCMILDMKLRNYSDATINMYTRSVAELARYWGKSPLEISQAEVRDFFVHLLASGASAAKRHISHNAIKLFYKLNGQPRYMDFIPMPRVPRRIPEVLDEEEIDAILGLCKPLRYKFLFALIYSSGLRISEALNLRLSDIDPLRKTIRVRETKNGKERYTILSSKILAMLRTYTEIYAPESYIFYARFDKSRKMQKRRCQDVFHRLVLKAGIAKKAHVHTLRHSFATHLLERNTNIFYIMNLLGHASIRTTLIYLHMQRLDKLDIKSPLDLSDISLASAPPEKPQLELCIA